jgi:hypothetical protein
MGLLPKFYGTDISALFKQRYHGDVTIVPDMKVEEALGVKAIMHPSRRDMQSYIRGGRRASWPHLRRVKHLLAVEARWVHIDRKMMGCVESICISCGVASLLCVVQNMESVGRVDRG